MVFDIASASVASNLAIAVVSSSVEPLLLLDGDLRVVAVSTSFCRSFDLDHAATQGQPLAAAGMGEWYTPQFDGMLRAIADGDADITAYQFDLRRPGVPSRSLIVNAHRLDYNEPATVRLLVAVADVTDARAAERFKDDLLREKAVLLQELQHRVANSLQIIASVLLQSARRVQSEETRGHLRDAHNRVMSIATVQRQLSSTGEVEIHLKSYLTKLCASLGASMIHDPDRVKLVLRADDSVVTADFSVSLGLIVTELVINALKHAFPGKRPGAIDVAFTMAGAAWTLTVADNGIGMPVDGPPATPGLGTSIVKALAHQLRAVVEVEAVVPGTRISIIHAAVARADAVGDLEAV